MTQTPPPSTDPRTVDCPNCQARAGYPCTQPTDDSRVPVSWFHLARESRAQQAFEEAGE